MDDRQKEKEKRAYVSLYKKNTLPYSLTLCSILAELVYVVMILDVIAVSYWMGVTVIVNIILLFVLFTCAVKINIYDRKWSVAAMGVGVYMVARMFVFIPVVLKPFDRQAAIMAANILGIILLFTAGLLGARRSDRRKRLQVQLNQSNAG